MRYLLALSVILLATTFASSQNLYIKTFGNSKDKPVIFLHGGPGYNCANFEATTAQQLAEKGYYVIVYDRRGEGRSKDENARFTFQETFADLNLIYEKCNVPTATLIGHSFGGVVATLFADKHPDKVQSVILVASPVSLQETFRTIISSCRVIYETKKDSVNLNYISLLDKMDKNSIQYSSYCFMHAMQNGFYLPKNQTEEAKKIYSTFKSDTALAKYAAQMTYQAPQGFWKNERYTSIDLTENLKNLQAKNIKVHGLYGKDDGLYSGEQVKELQKLLGVINVKYIDDCSHNVFADQQSQFIEAIEMWAK